MRSLAANPQAVGQVEPEGIPAELNQTLLAKRLGVDYQTIGRWDKQGDCAIRSKEKDPDEIAWKFSHKAKRGGRMEKVYVPVKVEEEQDQPGKQEAA